MRSSLQDWTRSRCCRASIDVADLVEERLHVAEELMKARRGAKALLVSFERVPLDADDEMLGFLDAARDFEKPGSARRRRAGCRRASYAASNSSACPAAIV